MKEIQDKYRELKAFYDDPKKYVSESRFILEYIFDFILETIKEPLEKPLRKLTCGEKLKIIKSYNSLIMPDDVYNEINLALKIINPYHHKGCERNPEKDRITIKICFESYILKWAENIEEKIARNKKEIVRIRDKKETEKGDGNGNGKPWIFKTILFLLGIGIGIIGGKKWGGN